MSQHGGASSATAAAQGDPDSDGAPPATIDTSKPHPARMYDYYLGGYDNYEVDREAAERVLERAPEIRPTAVANRAFLHRAVRFMAGQGVSQYIDIGTGVPTAPHIHDTALAITPGAKVAYVDNDPIVRVHAQARLTSTGNNCFVAGDLREPDRILADPGLRALIDLDQPVGLLLNAVLHFIEDKEDPAAIVATLRDAVPAGSYLVASHITADFTPAPDELGSASAVYNRATATLNLRSASQLMTLFAGFDLVDPGLVQLSRWRPDPPVPSSAGAHDPDICGYGGVGRKI